MAATAIQIALLRRMVAEPTLDNFTDFRLIEAIETYPTLDPDGLGPGETGYDANVYNLNLAAADIWDEKAACLAVQYDYSAGASNFSRSQLYEQAMKHARYHRSRAMTKTMRAVKQPKETSGDTLVWIANLPESD